MEIGFGRDERLRRLHRAFKAYISLTKKEEKSLKQEGGGGIIMLVLLFLWNSTKKLNY